MILLFGGGEDTLQTISLDCGAGCDRGFGTHGRLDNVLGASIFPGDLSRVLLVKDLDCLAVDDKVSTLGLNFTLELSVDGIELEHVNLDV